jgi:hypothetical protein
MSQSGIWQKKISGFNMQYGPGRGRTRTSNDDTVSENESVILLLVFAVAAEEIIIKLNPNGMIFFKFMVRLLKFQLLKFFIIWVTDDTKKTYLLIFRRFYTVYLI